MPASSPCFTLPFIHAAAMPAAPPAHCPPFLLLLMMLLLLLLTNANITTIMVHADYHKPLLHLLLLLHLTLQLQLLHYHAARGRHNRCPSGSACLLFHRSEPSHVSGTRTVNATEAKIINIC